MVLMIVRWVVFVTSGAIDDEILNVRELVQLCENIFIMFLSRMR